MRKKLNKPTLGYIGLILVAIMTVIAYFMPVENAAATNNIFNDIIRVIVYNDYPSVTINSPKDEDAIANKKLLIDVFYENLSYIDFTLSYVDGDGNTVQVPLPRYTPTANSGDAGVASGRDTISINLNDLNLGYNTYVLTARAYSSIGYAEDTISFSFVPVAITNAGNTNETNNPIITIEYDDGVEQFEIMLYDESGKPVFNNPVVIEIPSPFLAGKKTIELMLDSYGLPAGKYYAEITAYKSIDTYDENGNQIKKLTAIDAPSKKFLINYKTSDALDGASKFPIDARGQNAINGSFKIDPFDYLFTMILLFLILILIAIYIIYKRRQKNYRVYYRNNSAVRYRKNNTISSKKNNKRK